MCSIGTSLFTYFYHHFAVCPHNSTIPRVNCSQPHVGGQPVTFIATPLEENGRILEVAASPAVAVRENATGEEMLTAEETNRQQENPAETMETSQDDSVTKEVVMEE